MHQEPAMNALHHYIGIRTSRNRDDRLHISQRQEGRVRDTAESSQDPGCKAC
jgi:hypothetical protein